MARTWFQATVAATLAMSVSGCYFFNFFRGHPESGSGGVDAPGTVIGQPLGDTAGGIDEAALASVHAIAATNPPAPIRPDPDLIVRRLLRAFRPEGGTLARQVGDVEQYTSLLGGASEDFLTPPQEGYDATSLLAVLKVAEETCRGLVAPNRSEHEGWTTILPNDADDEDGNVRFMIQRLTGRQGARIDGSQVTDLIAIMRAEEATVSAQWWASGNQYAKYVPACAALALDAEAMYL